MLEVLKLTSIGLLYIAYAVTTLYILSELKKLGDDVDELASVLIGVPSPAGEESDLWYQTADEVYTNPCSSCHRWSECNGIDKDNCPIWAGKGVCND